MNIWRLWCYALGEKSGKNKGEADKIAIIRTIIFLTYMMTNMFIIYGVIRTHHFKPCYNQQVSTVSPMFERL